MSKFMDDTVYTQTHTHTHPFVYVVMRVFLKLKKYYI